MYRRVRFVAGKDAGGRRSRSCGDDEDAGQRRIWPARRLDDFRERPLVEPDEHTPLGADQGPNDPALHDRVDRRVGGGVVDHHQRS
jgi:hypothetical protein